jgi:hypothetical protein
MKPKRTVETFLRKLWALEAQLVQAGFKPMRRWWRETIERFYRSGKRRLVVRKGRRVFASTCVAPRLAVAEMLFGQHEHVVGTPPLVYAFVSVKRDEAANRLRGIKAILDVLGEKYAEKGETIELTNTPAIFSVLTASYKLSVGETLAYCWLDEVSRWNDEGANPAEQVVGTIAPALATLPGAKMFLVSSPLGAHDYHARQFDLGETDLQCVAFGETWTINPTLSEADCRGMLQLGPVQRLKRRAFTVRRDVVDPIVECGCRFSAIAIGDQRSLAQRTPENIHVMMCRQFANSAALKLHHRAQSSWPLWRFSTNLKFPSRTSRDENSARLPRSLSWTLWCKKGKA